MNLKHVIAGMISIAIAGLSQAQTLNMLSSWNQNYAGMKYTVTRFAEMVGERSSTLKVDVKGPETVSSFEQLEPVRAGLFQVLYTHGGYHYGTTGIGMGMDAVDGDPEKRRTTGIWDAVDASYQQLGLKLIAIPTSGDGYHMVLTKPVGADGKLTGMKIRGTPVYKALLDHLGASLVVLPPAEIYSALDKGTVDGAAWPVLGALGFKWYETAGYMLRPRFGDTSHLILMNLNTFNALSASDQALMLKIGSDLEVETYQQFYELAEQEVAELTKLGMKTTQLAPDIEASLPKVWADGIFGLVEAKNGAAGTAFADLARSTGMAP
jgi:TRAP-type transport system periplasmic protein